MVFFGYAGGYHRSIRSKAAVPTAARLRLVPCMLEVALDLID